MKKVNFNSLQSLSPPESWIEKAVAIPEKESKKTAAISLLSRVSAAAAVLAVITAVSVALFLNTGDRSVATMPSRNDVTVQSTDPSTDNGATGGAPQVFVPDTSADPDVPGGTAAEQTDTVPPTDAVSPSGAASRRSPRRAPSEQPSQSGTHSPTQASTSGTYIYPTSAKPPASGPATEPAQPETQAPTSKPTEAPTYIPTQYPTQPATQKPTFRPTEPVTEPAWETPTEPVEESTSAVQEPSQVPSEASEPPELILCGVTITKDLYVRDGSPVYCKITDISNGTVYGDPDLYSDEHLAAQTAVRMNTVTCEYRPGDHGIMLRRGVKYKYTFYDADGYILYIAIFKNN